MARGYMGKILIVDLSTGTMHDEPLDESMCREYLGGYGIGAKILYDRMSPGVDALGPDNLLGFFTGPLTGSPSIEGNRFVVVCKSPLTDTWGDANCGGTFGPQLKSAGYDGILFSGISEKPVYLVIEDGKAELRDAEFLWGKDSNETEDILKETLGESKGHDGKAVEVACIGQAGEKLSLLSAIMNDKGRAAGRSGVGAVMGSKKLKAITASGNAEIPLFDAEKAGELRKKYMKLTGGGHELFAEYGTIGITGDSAMSGDAPIKNWGGVGPVDFPTGGEKFHQDTLIAYQDKKYGCWRCTMACGGHMSVKEAGPYKGVSHHKVEYETAGSWGTMTLTDDFPAMIKINELCNRFGFDTIGAGCTAAFAVECYENGILTKEDTDGIELTWGNGAALVALLEKMGAREGIGDTLADGTRKAAEQIGKGSEKYAMHVKGQELPMHEPRLKQGMGVGYSISPTGADHCHNIHDTVYISMTGLMTDIQALGILEPLPADDLSGNKVRLLAYYANWMHFLNSAVACYFVMSLGRVGFERISRLVNAATGWNTSVFEILKVGERAANLARVFNMREGFTSKDDDMPERFFTPHGSGPLPVALDREAFEKAKQMYYDMMDWPEGSPSPGKLAELGVAWAIAELPK